MKCRERIFIATEHVLFPFGWLMNFLFIPLRICFFCVYDKNCLEGLNAVLSARLCLRTWSISFHNRSCVCVRARMFIRALIQSDLYVYDNSKLILHLTKPGNFAVISRSYDQWYMKNIHTHTHREKRMHLLFDDELSILSVLFASPMILPFSRNSYNTDCLNHHRTTITLSGVHELE